MRPDFYRKTSTKMMRQARSSRMAQKLAEILSATFFAQLKHPALGYEDELIDASAVEAALSSGIENALAYVDSQLFKFFSPGRITPEVLDKATINVKNSVVEVTIMDTYASEKTFKYRSDFNLTHRFAIINVQDFMEAFRKDFASVYLRSTKDPNPIKANMVGLAIAHLQNRLFLGRHSIRVAFIGYIQESLADMRMWDNLESDLPTLLKRPDFLKKLNADNRKAALPINDRNFQLTFTLERNPSTDISINKTSVDIILVSDFSVNVPLNQTVGLDFNRYR